ncbi:hypothetical protein [Roseateles amylovorans]|uniref:Uncharacterized protein n=1 Tax=Roseateles amylovorans TaxID=2978473 RepID=A0ABY6B288_9BURK|nr:hypothetical protein [Roseateles amylovorans]UXH79298.1 hypothetical protein N4261_05020 [Roseateles amylovorans]
MRSEITVVLAADQTCQLAVEADDAWRFGTARDWLDEQFVLHRCEPLRRSGKVLLTDKVLAVAAALGVDGFADPATARAFARAAAAALGKSVVTVDVPRMSVTS